MNWKEILIKINEQVGKEFKTDYGMLNEGNLEFVCSMINNKSNAYKIAENIWNSHPFIDGNKRVSVIVMYLLKGKYDETNVDDKIKQIIQDNHDLLRLLAL